ncbi:methyltransferase [Marinomonas epiphytica]
MTPLQKRFQQLDQYLVEHTEFWQLDHFLSLNNPWQENHPKLAQYMDSTHMENLSEGELFSALQSFIPHLKPVDAWLPETLRPAAKAQQKQPDSHFLVGIKGRKWAQIEQFSKQLPSVKHYLEWCSGKGHLGKMLAFVNHAKVTSIEWQKSLCEQGQLEAKKRQLKQSFIQQDVLNEPSEQAFISVDCAVALHACGDLHKKLLQQVVINKINSVCLSPCCYHLTQDPVYQPLSLFAHSSQLTLRKADLKLAVKEVVTAGKREQHLKHQELIFRLGFDAWQRRVQNCDQYLPLPSVNKRLIGDGFEAFCIWAFEQKRIKITIHEAQLEEFYRLGQERASQVQKREKVSQLFRLALENWLVLDRAMYLEEQGYQVEIGQFCDKNLTPRNWMIRGQFDT